MTVQMCLYTYNFIFKIYMILQVMCLLDGYHLLIQNVN